MPSAGALPAPYITPIHRDLDGSLLPTNKIDTATLIGLSTDAPNCKIYFTTDGSKPLPFQRKIGGKEKTFKYFAPFCLKSGKRTVKAVAVSRDGLLESAVVSKDFSVLSVDKDGGPEGYESSSTSLTLQSFREESSDGEYNLKPGKVKGAISRKSPSRRVALKEAWADSMYQDPAATGASNENQYPPIPDGPFNPVNYSGNQINVWGAPPANWPGFNGMSNFGAGPPAPPYPVQYGFLTESMIQGLKPKEEKPHKPEGITVSDIRKLMEECAPKPAPPAIEYKAIWKDPPLNPVSPGNDDYQGNILHIFAHLLQMAKSKANFKNNIGEYKMGKILEAKIEDEGDGFNLNIVFEKPGTERGFNKKRPSTPVKKTPPKETKPKETKPKETKPKVPTPPKETKPKVTTPPKETKPKVEVPPPVPTPAPPKQPEHPKLKPKSDAYFEKEIENIPCEGTLKPFEPFNSEADAEVLHKAMKGLGTDEGSLIDILAYRSSPQRAQIVTAYKTMFGKDLIEDIKSETSGKFCEALKSLCLKPAEFDAQMLRRAIKGLGTDEDVLIEILCTRSNTQIQEIKAVYQQKFNKSLESDIIGDTSGHFKRLLVSLLQSNRSDSKEVDRTMANQDAKALYQAGEGKWGTEESQFNKILVARSFPQLRATFEEYQKISKKDIEEVLKSEFSGNILSGLKTIVRCVKNRFQHFARQLQKSMKGLGTDDSDLIRILISRCEIDLVQIKDEFKKLTRQPLEQYIKDDTSGDYQRLLLALAIGGAPPKPKAGKSFVESVKNKTDEQLDAEVKMENEPRLATPTLKPYEGFNAEQDCEVLRKAMKGLGTDENAIIQVLGYRSMEQRQKIALTYKTMFGKDLANELAGELSSNFKKICVDMLLGPAEFDAKQLNKAIKGLGTDEQVLIEIICTRTNDQLNKIKAAYKTMFGKDLEADVKGDTSGDLRRLLVGCLQANRPEGTEFDRNMAKQDAQALLNAGEKKWGTDESRFQTILVSRSYAQLRATFQEYAKLANKDIEDSIKSEMSGDLCNGLLAIVRVIRGTAAYFAHELYKAMKGLGTNDDTLVRIVASRCEVDMVQIKEEFQKAYKQTLAMFIADDTSGDYRKMLLTLIGEPPLKK